jgi:2'-5' RNA ligase
LERVTAEYAPFTLHVQEIGGFPNRKRPRVIWVSLAGDTAALANLQRDIATCLVPLGWEREKRPFQAHLTLGRVKDSRQAAALQWQLPVPQAKWEVTAVHLIESQLRPQGPIYTTRHSSKLRGSRQS